MPLVCSHCIDEPCLAEYIEENASEDECSYCDYRRAGWELPSAMDLDELLAHMRERIEMEYEDAANSVGYESREGGYLLPTMDGDDLLREACPDWEPRSEGLRDEIANEFKHTLWVHKDPYSLTKDEAWNMS